MKEFANSFEFLIIDSSVSQFCTYLDYCKWLSFSSNNVFFCALTTALSRVTIVPRRPQVSLSIQSCPYDPVHAYTLQRTYAFIFKKHGIQFNRKLNFDRIKFHSSIVTYCAHTSLSKLDYRNWFPFHTKRYSVYQQQQLTYDSNVYVRVTIMCVDRWHSIKVKSCIRLYWMSCNLNVNA